MVIGAPCVFPKTMPEFSVTTWYSRFNLNLDLNPAILDIANLPKDYGDALRDASTSTIFKLIDLILNERKEDPNYGLNFRSGSLNERN